MTTAYRVVSSRFSAFFVEGEAHVFMAYKDYTRIVSDSEVALGDMLAKWLQQSQDEPKLGAVSTASPSTTTLKTSTA